jgi:hypothetical protein
MAIVYTEPLMSITQHDAPLRLHLISSQKNRNINTELKVTSQNLAFSFSLRIKLDITNRSSNQSFAYYKRNLFWRSEMFALSMN